MKTEIDNLKKVRIFLLDLVKDLSIDQVNKIPPGFNNNVAWNIAHIVAAQQGVCYIRAGIDPIVDDRYVTPFRSGTKPAEPIDESELSTIKNIMISSLDRLQVDYEKNIFSVYTSRTTRYGVKLTDINEQLVFYRFIKACTGNCHGFKKAGKKIKNVTLRGFFSIVLIHI